MIHAPQISLNLFWSLARGVVSEQGEARPTSGGVRT